MSDRYRATWRRTLLDMHIPDWDPGFLAELDPKAIVDAYDGAGVAAVMLYCKSHVGLCYWPTERGAVHGAEPARDFVGEATRLLADRDVPVCAYYSIVYDNYAASSHPEWAMRTRDEHALQDVVRYGWCCLNNPDYRAYELALLSDLLTSYRFEALFLDMIFWPIVCYCDVCKERWSAEADGTAIPETVDWRDPAWCRFQRARERWAAQWAQELADTARALVPEMEVTHNLSPSLTDWHTGQPPLAAEADDFVAGDLYGDLGHELTAVKLMLNLSRQQPPEYMTSICVNLGDHTQLKSAAQLRQQALAAVGTGAAFAVIDAIDPSGRINAAAYERVAEAFSAIEPYESVLGGRPVEQVAVYFAVDSRLDLAQGAQPVTPDFPKPYPHLDAVVGACQALQQAHVLFGVITRRDLHRLDDFDVLVLPAACRLSSEEATAFEQFVRAGGRLYASHDAGVVASDGTGPSEGLLAEVLGCARSGAEAGPVLYVTPSAAFAASAIFPQEHVSLKPEGDPLSGAGRPALPIPQVRLTTGTAVAAVTEPYAYPAPGTVQDRRWASIHSSPPWQPTDRPAIVTNDHGLGRTIYSVAPLESYAAEAPRKLLIALVHELLGDREVDSDLPEDVWLSLFDTDDRRTCTLFCAADVARPWSGRVSLPIPSGRRVQRVRLVGDGDIDATVDQGVVRCAVDSNAPLVVIAVEWERGT
jgi:hypothetical protein